MNRPDRSVSTFRPPARPLWRIIADPLLVLAVLGAIGFAASRRPESELAVRPPQFDPDSVVQRSAAPSAESEFDADDTDPVVEPDPPPPPGPDLAAVAAAEARLAAAKRQRLEAETLAVDAEKAVRRAELAASREALSAKTIASRIRDPRTRIASIQTRGAVLTRENARLAAELTSMANAPRPRRKVLSDRTPVARAVQGSEYHFEVRGERVTFIDLERLVDKLEADAKLQIRLAMGAGRSITSTVGPVGAFSLRYVLGPTGSQSLGGMLGGMVSYDLSAWEVVPHRNLRGETLSAITQPASEFAQVVNSLNPNRETITLWIYPDGFGTFRELQSYLHARGFQVAARPLPTGIPIRGSPNGSLSAGQ